MDSLAHSRVSMAAGEAWVDVWGWLANNSPQMRGRREGGYIHFNNIRLFNAVKRICTEFNNKHNLQDINQCKQLYERYKEDIAHLLHGLRDEEIPAMLLKLFQKKVFHDVTPYRKHYEQTPDPEIDKVVRDESLFESLADYLESNTFTDKILSNIIEDMLNLPVRKDDYDDDDDDDMPTLLAYRGGQLLELRDFFEYPVEMAVYIAIERLAGKVIYCYMHQHCREVLTENELECWQKVPIELVGPMILSRMPEGTTKFDFSTKRAIRDMVRLFKALRDLRNPLHHRESNNIPDMIRRVNKVIKLVKMFPKRTKYTNKMTTISKAMAKGCSLLVMTVIKTPVRIFEPDATKLADAAHDSTNAAYDFAGASPDANRMRLLAENEYQAIREEEERRIILENSEAAQAASIATSRSIFGGYGAEPIPPYSPPPTLDTQSNSNANRVVSSSSSSGRSLSSDGYRQGQKRTADTVSVEEPARKRHVSGVTASDTSEQQDDDHSVFEALGLQQQAATAGNSSVNGLVRATDSDYVAEASHSNASQTRDAGVSTREQSRDSDSPNHLIPGDDLAYSSAPPSPKTVDERAAAWRREDSMQEAIIDATFEKIAADPDITAEFTKECQAEMDRNLSHLKRTPELHSRASFDAVMATIKSGYFSTIYGTDSSLAFSTEEESGSSDESPALLSISPSLTEPGTHTTSARRRIEDRGTDTERTRGRSFRKTADGLDYAGDEQHTNTLDGEPNVSGEENVGLGLDPSVFDWPPSDEDRSRLDLA